MSEPQRDAITSLLQRWRHGDKAAMDDILPIVYDELRRLARARLKTDPAQSVQATALVD